MEEQPPKKVLVLVVEDEPAILTALHHVIEKKGLRVFEAKNGEEGLLVAFREHPDLILLDIVMPVMDGWTMLQKIREHDAWGKQVPVIVLTNLSVDEDPQIRHIVELGPAYFLEKSDWKVEGVTDKIFEVLNRDKHNSQGYAS